MFKAAVYSDDFRGATEIARAVKNLLSEFGAESSAEAFDNLNKLYHAQKNNAFDLIITDTNASGGGNISGIDFVRRLRGEGCYSEVIFLSDDDAAARAAFAAYPTAYIVKPITRRTLRPPLIYIIGKRGAEPSVLVRLRDGGRTAVHASEIDYIEVMHTDVDIHTARGILECTGALSTVLDELPEGMFYRVHRSYAVNLSKVAGYDTNEFILESGARVPVAKNRFAESKRALREYEARKGLPD